MEVRNRPLNLKWGGVMVYCFVQNFFFGQHKSQNIYLFCRAKREIFLKNSTSGYVTKTLNQIIVFCLHQNQNIFFQQHWESEYFFKKKHNPLFQLNGRSLSILHIYKSNLGPSNSDGSNTMDGSNLFESPANFPYIFKLKKIFRSNTDTSNSRT